MLHTQQTFQLARISQVTLTFSSFTALRRLREISNITPKVAFKNIEPELELWFNGMLRSKSFIFHIFDQGSNYGGFVENSRHYKVMSPLVTTAPSQGGGWFDPPKENYEYYAF
jgi:hypothetical protein